MPMLCQAKWPSLHFSPCIIILDTFYLGQNIETANFEGLQQRKIIQAALVKVLLLVLKIFAQTRNKNQY